MNVEPTRGERNNNPTNLRWFHTPWIGLANPPVDDGGYCVFLAPDKGLRAGALNLYNQQRLHDLRSIADIIPRFAPAADHNLVPAYIAAVAKYMAVSPTKILDLSNAGTLRDLLIAIIIHENGRCIYTPQQVSDAVSEIIGTPGSDIP